jgi:hypothetical protein
MTMCKTCKIRWINDSGEPTPDDNPAIGVVWLPARSQWLHGKHLMFSETERFPICAEHAKQLARPDMSEWRFEPFTPTIEAIAETPRP